MDCGLGIKHELGIKSKLENYGLSIKRGLRTEYIKTALERLNGEKRIAD